MLLTSLVGVLAWSFLRDPTPPPAREIESPTVRMVPAEAPRGATRVEREEQIAPVVERAQQEGGEPASVSGVQSGRADTPEERAMQAWISQVARECDLEPKLIEAYVADSARRVDIIAAWEALTHELDEGVRERCEQCALIVQAREKAGRYSVLRPGEPLPDADPRTGEFITQTYEPNPEGGSDLVRVIRIFPGESPGFDRALLAEQLARENRRDVVRSFVLK